jgi:hypothetical protein
VVVRSPIVVLLNPVVFVTAADPEFTYRPVCVVAGRSRSAVDPGTS